MSADTSPQGAPATVGQTVRAQYEAYPYPTRDPRDEARRLVTGSPSRLDELNHYIFDGRLRFDAGARPLRVLVAGGGTGDALVMLAQQLDASGRRAEIVYLDLSTASRAIAEARIAARGLSGAVRFITGSLFDAAQHGPFDYIDCCGVLHHLADPPAGLAALRSALTPQGGIGFMVYAEHGRAGVYLMQRALAHVAPPSLPMPERINRARALLAALPPLHPFRQSTWLRDHLSGDAGLVDLLLHSQDRPYTVPQVLEFIADAGLHAAALVPPLLYEPRVHARDAGTLAAARGMAWPQRAALAELLSGTMIKHIAYARQQPAAPQALDDPAAIPVLCELDGAAIAAALQKGGRFELRLETVQLAPSLPRLAPAMLSRIDGRRSWQQIRSDAETQGMRATDAAWSSQQAELAETLLGIGRLFLRKPQGQRDV